MDLLEDSCPKGINFDNTTDEQIKRIGNWINKSSMKVLDWKSPNEMFNSVAI